MKKISNKKLSFIIAFLYVGFGTIYSYNFWNYGGNFASGEFETFLYYFFYPVSIFPLIIIFTESEPCLYLFISQTITLFAVWGIFYLVTNLFRKESKTSDNTLKDFLENKDK